MKRIILSIFCLLMICTPLVQGAKQPDSLEEPTKLFYAADYADVLSSETETFIVEHSASLSESAGAQVVVVTIPDLRGKDVNDYALDLLRTWKVGSEKNDGVVILVSTGDRQIGVSVGYGLEGRLNDAKVGRLLDNLAIPSLKENDYDTGLFQLYNGILSEVYQEYNLEVPETVKSLEDYESEEDGGMGSVWVGIIVFLLIFLPSLFRKNKGGPPGFGSGGRGMYMGGFGGGGRPSGGGGFGGFSGGGGSGGGGGSSRGF